MLSRNKVISFLSASDRINYGDLLFPIICKKLAEERNIKFKNYAIIKSDLSYFGALPTNSYKALLEELKAEKSNVIVGGGEVLFASWESLWSNINIFYKKFLRFRILRKIDQKFKISPLFFFQTSNRFPFIINSNQKHLIFYNAIGGSSQGNLNLKYFRSIFQNLKTAQYISVRDIQTKRNLIAKNIESTLCPDSALLLSDLFDINFVRKKTTLQPEIFSKSYLFFQMGKNFAPKDIAEFSKDLLYIGEELEVMIVLCPIGLALGHEDDVVLKELSLFSKKFILFSPKNLYEIIQLIALSKAYIGTSLHGLITAQSYGVPFIPINKKVKKADFYCKSWTKGNIEGSIDICCIKDSIDLIKNWNYKIAKENLIYQKKLIYNNFDLIFSQLE